jgi:hypothetical protein
MMTPMGSQAHCAGRVIAMDVGEWSVFDLSMHVHRSGSIC